MMAKKVNWERRADAEVKRIALSLGHCERCGDTNHQLHHHHIISRTSKSYRHDLNNIATLCVGCHAPSPYGRPDSAHNDATTFYKWLQTTDKWAWFEEHTVRHVEVIANMEVVRYKPIKIKHRGDEVEYNELKEID